MTRQEIMELKEKIDKYFDILEKKFLYTQLISDTLDTLLKHGTTPSNIEIFLHTMGEFVDDVKVAITEIEN